MFECLESFESGLDEESNDMRRGLVILDIGQAIPSILPKTSRPVRNKVFQLVGLYRLVDVLNALHSEESFTGTNPKYFRMPEIGVLKSQRVCIWIFFLEKPNTSQGMADD